MDGRERASLQAIPLELLEYTASWLDYSSLLSLRWTSRSMHNLLPHPSSSAAGFLRRTNHPKFCSASRSSQLLAMELWPCYLEHFTCHLCETLLPAWAFAIGMISNRKAKGKDGGAARFCIKCGVERGTYKRGDMLRFAAVNVRATDGLFDTAIVCKRCGLLKPVTRDSSACLRRKCDDCLIYRPP